MVAAFFEAPFDKAPFQPGGSSRSAVHLRFR
jgi:hypothetical protein